MSLDTLVSIIIHSEDVDRDLRIHLNATLKGTPKGFYHASLSHLLGRLCEQGEERRKRDCLIENSASISRFKCNIKLMTHSVFTKQLLTKLQVSCTLSRHIVSWIRTLT